MPRSLWSGTVSFGLVSIPVSVISAKEQDPLSFHMLDKRDFARIGYKTVNKNTGKELTRDQIVKGYEYEKNKFVVITDKDFERANPKATHSIDLEDFIDFAELDPLLLEKPYYLIPAKHGEKAYLLLRRVLEETKKVAIGRFVLRQKQKLVAVIARGDYLVLEVLRYAREVLDDEELDLVQDKLKNVKVSPKELQMAESLVKGMTTKWDAKKYEDTYTADVLRMIKEKVKKGGSVESEAVEDAPKTPRGNIVDLMPLLKQSLEKSGSTAKPANGKTSAKNSGKNSGKKSAAKKKKSGLHLHATAQGPERKRPRTKAPAWG